MITLPDDDALLGECGSHALPLVGDRYLVAARFEVPCSHEVREADAAAAAATVFPRALCLRLHCQMAVCQSDRCRGAVVIA